MTPLRGKEGKEGGILGRGWVGRTTNYIYIEICFSFSLKDSCFCDIELRLTGNKSNVL